jgi:TolB-like protein/tetratricopeptide (TPR) repeat protein
MSFFSELKRRNVFRVGLLYLAVGWLILQATDVLSSLLELPTWVGKLVVILLAIGLPIALAISWLYELTPEGLKRDSSLTTGEVTRRETAGRLDLLTIIAAVLAILVIGADRLIPEHNLPGVKSDDVVALAVLPFVNLSSETDQEYFADGITEEVLNLLANVQGLRVTSRTSSFSFKGQSIDLPTIARKLGVTHVVEGSVRKAGNNVRVTAQLIDVDSDAHIWSQNYDREVTNVFGIQSDVAGQIARVLAIALSADELSLIGERPTTSLTAWQNFVTARSIYRNRVGWDDIDKSMTLVDAAIADDPTFARAHSLRSALLYSRAFSVSQPERADEMLQSAIETANYALELAPQLGEPYFILAQSALARGQLKDADQLFRDAIARAPNNADGRDSYGLFLLEAGYLDRAWAEKKRAAELDPLSPIISWQVAYAAVTVGHLEFVSEFAEKSRENGWPGWQPEAIEGAAAMQRKQIDVAEAHYAKAFPQLNKQVAEAFTTIRKKHIDEVSRASLNRQGAYGPPGAARFHVEVATGDLDAAFSTAWSELDVNSLTAADGSGGPARRSAGKLGEPIRADWWSPPTIEFRQDPRFTELMRAVGLIAFWQEHGWPDLCQPDGDQLQCR